MKEQILEAIEKKRKKKFWRGFLPFSKTRD